MKCKSALSQSRLPGLDWALNPYRGCEHSCAYCYAQDVTRFEPSRPWGDVLEVKSNIVQVLAKELRRRREGVVGVGTVTDPYQPAEARFELTRGCLRLLRSSRTEASVLTKSPLVLRDLDVLEGWAGAEVGLSVSTLDEGISAVLEPGAPAPKERMSTLGRLSASGVRTYLMAAPIMPGLSGDEGQLGELISQASAAGVKRVIWDMYNQKPIAHGRLRAALESAELLGELTEAGRDEPRIREFLESECRSRGIEVEYAF